MRQLLPEPATIDPVAAHRTIERLGPVGRPWVMTNMIVSIDGATAVAGVSGGLGGAGDKAVFAALRGVADVIVVAAGTVRAEAYGPPRTPEAIRADRVAHGQSPFPRLAVVTGSIDLDLSTALFTEAPEPPLIFTVTDAPTQARAAAEKVAEVHAVGDSQVDLTAMTALLGGLGARLVLLEGGPSLNGQMHAAGLIDEVNVSVAPMLVGGDSLRLAVGPQAEAERMGLAHLWEQDDTLFARYVRR